MDYISDNFLKSTRCVNGKLLTKGGTSYKAIISPAVKLMPSEVLDHLLKLAQAGADVYKRQVIDNLPNMDVLLVKCTKNY